MLNLCWYILGLPLAAAAIIALALIPAEKASSDKNQYRSLSAWLSVLSIAASFLLSLIVLRNFFNTDSHHGEALETSLTWMLLPHFRIEVGLMLNSLTLLMLLLVTG